MNNPALLQKTLSFGQSSITVDTYCDPLNQHTLILLPALGVELSKYQKLITALINQGFNLVLADYPHCGRNTPWVSKEINYGYADLLNDFIPKLVAIALDISTHPPILCGHSLGGHLATLYAQQHDNKIIGIATGNIGLKYWDLKGKINILKAVTVINSMILKAGYFAGYKISFGQRETRSLMRDWSKVVFTGNYKHIIQHEHISNNAALFIHFKGDEFAPLSSTLGLSRYFHKPQVSSLDLTQKRPGNQHSVWIKDPDELIDLIKKWLNCTA